MLRIQHSTQQEKRIMLKVITIMSAVGGAGATTVAANLSAALTMQHRPALAMDCCPENRLRLHFGMALRDGAGWATALLDGASWHESAYRSSAGIDFVPFGEMRHDAQLDDVIEMMRIQPQWFRTEMAQVRFPSESILICDCPRMPAAFREQLIPMSDLVLVVTSSDSVSYSIASRVAHATENGAGPRTLVVLNGFDPLRQLDRDIALLLRTRDRALFVPAKIHRDEALREALACKQTVFTYAPSSQATHDFASLAGAVLARLGETVEQP